MDIHHREYTVPLDNLDGFAAAIDSIGKMDEKAYGALLDTLKKYMERKKNTECLQERYLEMFRTVVEENKRRK